MKTIIYAVEIPNGVIIEGVNYIIVGIGKEIEKHGKGVLSEAR
jgi:hypothetical protein